MNLFSSQNIKKTSTLGRTYLYCNNFYKRTTVVNIVDAKNTASFIVREYLQRICIASVLLSLISVGRQPFSQICRLLHACTDFIHYFCLFMFPGWVTDRRDMICEYFHFQKIYSLYAIVTKLSGESYPIIISFKN